MATRFWLYALPTDPLASETVLITSAELMVSENALSTKAAEESVSRTVTLVGPPAIVGVPLITPPVLSVRPVGSAPDDGASVQVYPVPVPPVPASVWEYDWLTVPFGMLAVEIASPVLIVSVRFFDVVKGGVELS